MELLEREHCLQTLRSLLSHAIQGSGRVALIGGEAGIGKTALVERFSAEHPRGARLLWGACDALFSPRPLGPLYDIARQTGGGLSALLESDADRPAIFYAALSELGRTPSIVILEDVHWADEATLDLLCFLGRRLHHTPVLLLLTYRDDELGPSHPLRSVLGAFASSAATCRVTLAPLSVDAVRRLAGERPIDTDALHSRTGGNPFFVSEVLASDGQLPSTVRDAVLARAARLSPPARELLDMSAAIGVRVEPWLLASISTDFCAAEECLASGVLKAQGELLAFRHELARQIIWEAVPPHRRIGLHRVILAVLRSSSLARSEPARIAAHADAAGDSAAVLLHAPEAARLAGLRGAHREATELLSLALRHTGGLAAERHAALLEHFARHASRIDRRAEAIRARCEAIELWRIAGDQLRQGENYASLVIMLIGAGRTEEAEQASQAAITLFEAQASLRHLALGYETKAALRLFNGQHAEALGLCEHILGLPGIEQHGYIWRRTRMRKAVARLFQDYREGCAELEHMLGLARRAARSDAEQEVEAVNLITNLAWRSTQLFNFRAANSYLADGLAYSAERDCDILRRIMLAAQATVNLYLGEWHNVEPLVRDLLPRASASVLSRVPALEAVGRLRARRGDAHVWDALDLALELAEPTANLQLTGSVLAARAEAAWLAGDNRRCLAEAGVAYQRALAQRHPWIAGELTAWLRRAGAEVEPAAWLAAPYRMQLAGDWRGAADAWHALGCPFEQALALADGDAGALVAALAILDRLGAMPAADVLRARLRASGAQSVPRGPRPLTRGNRYGLTARQTEILALLGENLTNAEIARQLHLSAKTVDHHVSAVLAKLDVRTRRAAGLLARSANT